MAARKFIPCSTCGAVFKQTIDSRKFCCRACYEKSREIQPKTCAHCGVSFVKKANQKFATFCSDACMTASRRVKPHTCVTCGAVFSPVKFKKSENRFVGATGRHNCSKACIDAWKAKTKSAYMRANRDKFSGPNSWNWIGSCLTKSNEYRGNNWSEVAEKARKRDGYKCAHCGTSHAEQVAKFNRALSVHHVIPFHEFTDYKKANRLSNLITLCQPCHATADRAVKQRQMLFNFSDAPRIKCKDGIHRGERNARAVLKESQVCAIKKMLKDGARHQELAEMYGVKRGVIAKISIGKTWKHVL